MTLQTHPVKVKIGSLMQAGAILQIQDGNHGEKHPTASDYVDHGIPFIMAKDLQGGAVNLASCKFISRERAEDLRVGFAKTDDVLISHKGTVGSVAIVPEVTPFVMLTPQVTYYRLNQERIDGRYLAYAFQHPDFQGQLASFSAQSTRPYIGITNQRNLEVLLPPLSTQRKISYLLSAYDDLIENNARRIRILEEMAQRIYREWFVHFRFPGHEKVGMVESELGPIPEGWEVKKLGDVVELAYGKALKKDSRKHGSIPVYGSGGVVGYHDKNLVGGPGIIVGRKGNVGSVYWSDYDFFPIDTVYYIRTKTDLHYVYYNLQDQNFLNNDAAVPGLNRNQAYSLPFLLPDVGTLGQFQRIVDPVFQQLKVLKEKNDNLRRTRDLLLPKLISGEVSVEGLDIDLEKVSNAEFAK